MRVKVRENWESIRQSVTKWPNSVRISIAQAIQERRQDAEDPNHSKIFTFAWPSASSTSSSTTKTKVRRSPSSSTQTASSRCTFRRCWTQLQRLLFDESPSVPPASPARISKSPAVHQQQKMTSKTAKASQPVVHKVIMVGSGGVGKSALTLQFMYDEVRQECYSSQLHHFRDSGSDSSGQVRSWILDADGWRSVFWLNVECVQAVKRPRR